MADLARIKENVAKMAAMNAPEEDIDGYIKSEGVSIAKLRDYRPQTWDKAALGAVSALARGASLGLADKVGGAFNAAFGAPFDALLTDKSFARAVKDRYHEIVDDAEQSRKDFSANNPKTAFGLELGGNVFGAGNAIFGKLAQAGLKGTKLLATAAGIEGAIQGAADSEQASDIASNALKGGAASAALAPLLPWAVKGATWTRDVIRPAAAAKKRAIDEIAEKVGEPKLYHMVDQAQRYNSNLAATGDDKILDLAQMARQKTPEAASVIENRLTKLAEERPQATRRTIDLTFGRGNKYDNIDELVETTKANAAPLYDYLRKIGDLEAYVQRKIPAKRYKGFDNQKVLKSIRRNLQKNDPEFRMGVTPEGKIDYPHFLKDNQRAEYITTLPLTYKNPQQIIKGTHDGQPREYLLRQYYNPETEKDVYDMAVKAGDGSLITKLAREGRNGRREFEKLRQARASTGGTASRTGQTESASIPAGQHTVKINEKGQNVNLENSINLSPLGRFVKGNDLIQNEIRKIRKNPEFPREMRKAADTDFNILDQVNQNLGEMIEDAKRAGHMPTVMRLTLQKNELLKQMDKIAPKYKEARNLYEARGKALRAQSVGEDIFNPNVSPDLMRRKIKDMEWLEKNSLKIGATAELLRKLGQAPNEAVALGRILNDNSVQKLEAVYGKPAARVFKEYAEAEVKRNRNTNKILSGSQTSEKQSLRDRANIGVGILNNPTGAIGITLGAAEKRIMDETNKAIAELLTDPRGQMLLEELSRQKNNRIGRDLAEILQRSSIAAAVNVDK